MNKAELIKKLEEIINSYIMDDKVAKELIKHIDPLKIKYILGELERHKVKEYTLEDKEVIKDIYFYYC